MSGRALSAGRALRTELAVVAWEKRWQLLASLVLILVLIGLRVRANLAFISAHDFESVPLGPLTTANLYWLLILLAFVWPVSLWSAHPGRRRDYFWSLPVDQARHERLRVLAGGVWLLAFSVVAAVTIQLAVRLIGEAGEPWAFRSWFAFALVPMVLYLLCSLFVMRAGSPDRGWLLALLAVVIVSLGLSTDPEVSPIARAAGALFMAGDPQMFLTGPLLGPEMAIAWAQLAVMWVVAGVVGLYLVSSTRREGPHTLLRRRGAP